MGVNSLPNTVNRQRCGCDLNPGPSVLESGMLTTRLPNHLMQWPAKISFHSTNLQSLSREILGAAAKLAVTTKTKKTTATTIHAKQPHFLHFGQVVPTQLCSSWLILTDTSHHADGLTVNNQKCYLIAIVSAVTFCVNDYGI